MAKDGDNEADIEIFQEGLKSVHLYLVAKLNDRGDPNVNEGKWLVVSDEGEHRKQYYYGTNEAEARSFLQQVAESDDDETDD